jgi:hypothetical protein
MKILQPELLIYKRAAGCDAFARYTRIGFGGVPRQVVGEAIQRIAAIVRESGPADAAYGLRSAA